MACEGKCWKWVVLCGCFMINFIMEGSFSAFGVIYTDLFLYFRTTKSRIAWIGSLFFSLPLIGGAVTSMIAVKFGSRFAAIVGGVFAALGVCASAFVTSIELMYVTYGCVTGLALSLPYVASVLVLSQYFDTRLGLVNGIAECGAAVGTIVLPIVFEELLSIYGWRGALMVLSGLTLNIVVCGSLLRPAKSKRVTDRTKDAKPIETKDYSTSGDTSSADIQESPDNPSSETGVNTPPCNTQDSPSDTANSVSVNTPPCNIQGSPSDTANSVSVNTPPCNIQDTASHNSAGNCILQNLKENLQNDTVSEKEGKSTISKETGIIKLEGSSPKRTLESCNNPAIVEGGETTSSWCKTCMSALRLGIFTNVQFSVYIGIIFVLYLWIDVPYVYLPDRAIGLGISKKKAALLLSCIGILQLVGNILFGYVGDHTRFDNVIVFGISVVLSGISLALVPLFTTFGPLVALAGAFGFFTAAAESMCSVMLVEFLSIHKLDVGYGYGMTLKGIAELMGPPFAGWLFDISKSYDNTFYVAGGTLAVCGLVYTPVAKVIALHSSRKVVASHKELILRVDTQHRDIIYRSPPAK